MLRCDECRRTRFATLMDSLDPRRSESGGLAWTSPLKSFTSKCRARRSRYSVPGCLRLPKQAHPDVDVYAEKGSGLDTLVGIGLPNLTIGQLIDFSTQFFFQPGDGNQEDITNN